MFFTAQGFAKLGGGLAPPPSQRMSPYCSTPAGEARNYGQPCMTIGPVWCNRSQQGLQFRCQSELHSRVLKGRYLSCRGYKLSLRCPGRCGIFTKPCLAEFPLSECQTAHGWSGSSQVQQEVASGVQSLDCLFLSYHALAIQVLPCAT